MDTYLKATELTIHNTDKENLDPKDWNSFRQFAHTVLDEMIDFISNIRNEKAWVPMPDNVKQKFLEPMPETPSSLKQVYDEFKEFVMPYNKRSIHPRYWGWVEGTGTASGILYEMITATLNSNTAFGHVAGVHIEMQIMNWFSSVFGYGSEASGVITSGGSSANIIALAAARASVNAWDIKKNGLQSDTGKLRIYCSTETHNCIQKAAELLGLGTDAIRYIPVDKNFKIDTDALYKKIVDDKQQGDIPFCIVGNIGTVNTGAIDPLDELVAIAKQQKLWLHIDGAIGAVLKLLSEYGSQLAALGETDSISMDFHKWLYIQYDAAATVVKKEEFLKKAFSTSANYLMEHERGISAGPALNNTRIDLSRNIKNLKIWMSIKENGIEAYRRMIRKNLKQAIYLAGRIDFYPDLELMAPVETNVVAFRYNPSVKNIDLNMLNKEIVMQLQEDGKLVISSTVLDGKYCIRAAITNHRSINRDFDFLVNEVMYWGKRYLHQSISKYDK